MCNCSFITQQGENELERQITRLKLARSQGLTSISEIDHYETEKHRRELEITRSRNRELYSFHARGPRARDEKLAEKYDKPSGNPNKKAKTGSTLHLE